LDVLVTTALGGITTAIFVGHASPVRVNARSTRGATPKAAPLRARAS